MINLVRTGMGQVTPMTRVKRAEYVPGKLIVRVRETAIRPHLASEGLRFTNAEAKTLPQSVAGPISFLKANAGLKAMRPLFSQRQVQLERASVSALARSHLAVMTSVADTANEDLTGINIADVNPRELTPALIARLKASPAFDIIEPMPARWAAAADPMQNRQWSLRTIGWFRASLPNAVGINVGVMDTGIDANHPDFRGISIDYRHHGLSSRDLLGHGTHVAGIIAARTNNGVGISGIVHCRLTCWKIFADEPEADGEFYVDMERYLDALRLARDADLKVLNLSIGGTASSRVETLLFRRLEEAGVVVVAAMGNEFLDGNPTEYPAAYPTVFAVGAIAENLRRASFSNTGRHIAIVAPGVSILSTLPTLGSPYLDETGYAAWSGTSMATPHVTAAAALVAAKYPSMKPAEIKSRLAKKTTKLAAMRNKAWTREYGSGLLNLQKVLT